MGATTTSSRSLPSALASSEWKDTASDNTVQEIKASSAKVHTVSINNESGTADVYVNMWDKSASPTLGTDDPDFILAALAGEKVDYHFRDVNGDDGCAVANKLYLATSNAPGVNAAPTGTAPQVTVLYT